MRRSERICHDDGLTRRITAGVAGHPTTKQATVLARRMALPALRRIRPGHYSDAPPFQVLSLPTAAVTHMQRRWEGRVCLPWMEGGRTPHLPALRRRWHAGIVLDGDWDLATKSFTDYHLTQVLHARFVDGADWQEVPYVRKALDKVRVGQAAWGGRCRSVQDVHDRCAYLDRLHAELSNGGYRQVDATAREPAFSHFLVNIGRDGTIIRNNDGKHRIILARILGIPRLHARVLIRHRRWQQVRDAVRRGDPEAIACHGGHPDLQPLA